jgi:hypothetical protein
MADRTVEEVHAVRRRTCQECEFDLEKLGAYYVRLQNEYPANLIAGPPDIKPTPKITETGAK